MPVTVRKTVPECRCYVDTRSAIPFKGRPGAMVATLVGDRMAMGQGDGADTLNPTIRSWAAPGTTAHQVPFRNVGDAIEFVRFHKDGRLTVGASAYSPADDEVSGFTLKYREIERDARVNGQVAGSSGLTALSWQSVSGQHQSVRLDNGVAAIVNTGSGTTETARTTELPANQGGALDLQFARKNTSAAQEVSSYVSWGGDTYRAYLLHGKPLRVDKRVNGEWVSLRRLDNAPPVNLAGGNLPVAWWRWGGRLIVKVGTQHYHFLETQDGQATASSWPAGPVTISATRCRVRATFKLLSATDDAGAPLVDSYEDVSPYSGQDVAAFDGVPGGWQPQSDSVAVSVEATGGTIKQTVTLRATPDGTDVGFVSRTAAQFEPFSTTGTSNPIDIGPAVMRAHLSQAMPPIMPGAELSMEIDRVLLEGLMAQYSGKDWRNYTEAYCPITFETRWHYTAGPPGDWIKWFTGYVYMRELSSAEVGDGKMSLTCRDPIIRLQDPASKIEYRYPPLDFLFADKVRSRVAGGAQSVSNLGLYGADCVYEILRLSVGETEARRMNGGLILAGGQLQGLLDYFPNSHYPLIGPNNSAGYVSLELLSSSSPPTNGGWLFPPPVDDDALGWINQIGQKDHAVFFYGHANGYDGNYPHPVYGRITNIIDARNVTHHLKDAVYREGTEGDWDYASLLQQAQYGTRPENDINRVIVMANGPLGDGLSSILPAARIAEAQLPGGTNLTEDGWQNPDPNAATFTWERTKIIRDELSWFPGSAEAYAGIFMSLLKNVIYRWPSFTCIGRDYKPGIDPAELPINWGDKIVPQMDGQLSDSGLDLNGNTYRAEHIEQDWDFDANPSHVMQVWVRPLTSGGI